jgi:hypothetical protein
MLIFYLYKAEIEKILETIRESTPIKVYLEAKILDFDANSRSIVSGEEIINADISTLIQSFANEYKEYLEKGNSFVLTRAISINIIPQSHWDHPCARSSLLNLVKSLNIKCIKEY